MTTMSVIKDCDRPNPVCPPKGAGNYAATRYAHLDQRIINWLEIRAMRELLSLTGRTDGLTLNAPCGYGRFSDILSQSCSKLIYFDLHPQMMEMCKARYEANNTGHIIGSIRALPFRTATFDTVVTVRFFHHYFDKDDREFMLTELSRVSARYVIVTYYVKTPLHSLAKKTNPKGNRMVMLPPAEFKQELAQAGLKIIRHRALLPALHAQRFVLAEKA